MTENELEATLDDKAKEYGFKNFAEWRNYEHWSFDKIDVFLLELLHKLCRGEVAAPTRKADLERDGEPVCTKCYLVTGAQVNGVMLSELVEASSLCTGTALYDYIRTQLEKKYSPCFSIYGISDLGKVAT